MKPSFSENIVGTISHFFVTNRPLSIIVISAVIIFGLLSFWMMPKQYNPEIIRPAFAVTLSYQGATTQEALDRVVYELNEKIQTVPGVDEVYTTVDDGSTIETTIIFTVGHDAIKAKVDLLSQLEQHSYLAQGFIGHPQVMEINPETIPVLHIVFSTDMLGVDELRARVISLSHELSGVEGVSEITVSGGYIPALIVEVDPVKLAYANLTISDVARVLQTNQTRLVGNGTRANAYRLQMVFDGHAKTVDEIGLLHLRDDVTVRDVARVYEGTAGSRSYVTSNSDDVTKEVVTLSVAKVEGSSAPVVTESFLQKLNEIADNPEYKDVAYEVVSDDGATATAEINGLMLNLVSSVAIVAAVLLLFLSVRAAIVVLIAIPTTLVVVFGIGYLFDQTINRITLFALILSLGLLVDSAIVVVENIYSHLREWRKAPEGVVRERAVAGAVHEIGIGLILSTVTSVIVFLPMKYITGMMGPYMAPIAFFVPTALLVSMFVAIVVVPFIAAHILDPDEGPNRVTQYSTRLMEKITDNYNRFLRKILMSRNKQRTLLVGVLGLFLVTLLLPAFALVHFQMLPKADRDQFYMYVDLPVGTDIEETRRISNIVAAVVGKHQDIKSIQQFVGTAPMLDFNGMFKGAQARANGNETTLRVNLVSAADRVKSSTDIVSEIRSSLVEINPELIPYIRLVEDPPGPPVQATLVAKFSSDDEVLRTRAAQDFYEYLRSINGVVDIDESTDAPVSRIRYEYDAVAGDVLNVSPASVADALSFLGEPRQVGEYLASDASEYSPLMVATPSTMRTEPNDVGSIFVRSTTGEMVSLARVVTVHTEAQPSAVHLEDSTQLAYVTAEIEGRSIVYVTIDIIKGLVDGAFVGYVVTDWSLFHLDLKADDGHTVTLNWGGEWEMTLENFRDLGIAMIVALALVYAVLAAQYKRFDAPGYVLITVPLALIGILWGFFILDTFLGIYLTATALIGFIALVGIVVNNAIIYLEYVEQLEQAGYGRTEALLATGRARLRPIVLTSLTTILGSLTIAGDPVWSGLAWSIIFGLSLSTILTLIVYPTILVYFSKNK